MNNDQLQRHIMSGEVVLHTNDGVQVLSRKPSPRIKCRDGFTFSVQASQQHHCYPRATMTWPSLENYVLVEVGFPNVYEEMLDKYAEDPAKPTETVYANVPVDLVLMIINKHGGVAIESAGNRQAS